MALGINDRYDDSVIVIKKPADICAEIEKILKPSLTNRFRERINLYAPRWVSRILRWAIVSKELASKMQHHDKWMLFVDK